MEAKIEAELERLEALTSAPESWSAFADAVSHATKLAAETGHISFSFTRSDGLCIVSAQEGRLVKFPTGDDVRVAVRLDRDGDECQIFPAVPKTWDEFFEREIGNRNAKA